MTEDINRLVGRLQAGDQTAFDAIYEQTYKTVYFSVLPILRDRSLADDIVQDTYLRMIDRLSEYQERNFLAYLVTIARNLAFNEYKSRKRVRYTDDDLDALAPFSYESQLEIKAGNEELIKKALSVLDETEKSVVLLYNVSNLTHREIAVILDKPLGTVTWLYQRAIRKIRGAIKED